ncbi:helix-turn-helix domain-containing protein [Alicyclobacillus sp. SO9]|uniref:helix-turn-helix domain-containing protein n=1 Tax=Alicyclobacillus sp. SO9 TaxID=2665646 RepID=UPI0018E80A54|nr:helix-turn-helix transcriptional regulator [Alicyclobacillus sp. SO9]QQE80884.1 helix-turn-helix domain-containing protein [Alicyclobacillus sp. SO9]
MKRERVTTGETFGNLLRRLRGDMSLRDAAKKANVSHAYLDRIEKGIDPRSGKRIEPSVSVLRALATAYNIPSELALSLAGYIDSPIVDEQRVREIVREELAKAREEDAQAFAQEHQRFLEQSPFDHSKANPYDSLIVLQSCSTDE